MVLEGRVHDGQRRNMRTHCRHGGRNRKLSVHRTQIMKQREQLEVSSGFYLPRPNPIETGVPSIRLYLLYPHK